jgi:hypothetical protein
VTPTLSVLFGVELGVLEAARVAEDVTEAVVVLVTTGVRVPVFVGATDRDSVVVAVPVLDVETERV